MRILFPAAGCQLHVVSSYGGKREWALCGPFCKDIDPVCGAPPSWPGHLPKAPPPNTITSGVGMSTYEFGGKTDIQFID